MLDITGLSADSFVGHHGAVEVKPLDEKLTFREACLKLPVMKTRTIAMAQIVRKPWAIQVAGNFRRSAGYTAGGDLEYTFNDNGENLSADLLTTDKPVIPVIFGQAGLIAGATLKGTKYTRIIP